MTGALLLIGTALVALANGANDNFKPVATIYGAGTLGYRRALRLATVAQLAGSAASVVLAWSLVGAFGGKGLVPDAVVSGPTFLTAVAFGAATTILIATRLGLPISTTHGLVGGLVGAGLALAPAQVRWESLGSAFVLPLLASPLAALLIAASMAWIGRRVAFGDVSRALVSRRTLDRLHLGSAFSLGFARGLNDTPKVLALLVAARCTSLDTGPALFGVASGMALGGWVASRRIARTMGHEITAIDPARGLVANATASAMVIAASLLGMGVSTTHVTTGAIIGIGLGRDLDQHRRAVQRIVIAWVATLPIAMLLAYLAATALR